jgi:hypothetical protein
MICWVAAMTNEEFRHRSFEQLRDRFDEGVGGEGPLLAVVGFFAETEADLRRNGDAVKLASQPPNDLDRDVRRDHVFRDERAARPVENQRAIRADREWMTRQPLDQTEDESGRTGGHEDHGNTESICVADGLDRPARNTSISSQQGAVEIGRDHPDCSIHDAIMVLVLRYPAGQPHPSIGFEEISKEPLRRLQERLGQGVLIGFLVHHPSRSRFVKSIDDRVGVSEQDR